MLYVRPPVGAGNFYDLEKSRLEKQIETALDKGIKGKESRIRKMRAAIVPHAGYPYSGHIAGNIYNLLKKRGDTNFIIIGPNHYMLGSKFAIMKKGLWKTPLGGVSVDEEMAERLDKSCELLENDVIAHSNEHSIEVQLPFLQYIFGNDFKFVPISISAESKDSTIVDSCKIIGEKIADAIEESGEKWTLLATSDFSHYVPEKLAKETDKYVIDPILRLNAKDFMSRIVEKNASVCGSAAIATAIYAAKKLGSSRGKLLEYGTSADVTGDKSSVVGYASIVL